MENNRFHTPPPVPPPPPPPVTSFQAQPMVAQQAPQEMYNYAADLLINKKRPVNEVINELMQKGLAAQAASNIVAELHVEIAKQKKIRAKKDILYGGIVCIIGIAITAITYSIASSGSGGGTYYVSWGAILFGAIQFFRGVFNSMK